MGEKTAEVVSWGFLAAWLIAGASIDRIFDDLRALAIFVVAMIVIVACAAAMGGRYDDK